MIVDTFLFAWELDMLEMRFHEMNSFVDKFLIIESNKTFQGNVKPLYYDLYKERFKPWHNKIIHAVVELPDTDNPWIREFAARESVKNYFNKFPEDTIILHGDVDELISANLGKNLQYIIDHEIYTIEHRFYSMAVDWQYPEDITGIVIARKSTLNNMSMIDFRHKRIGGKKLRGGWHFTWLGGKELIQKKLESFSHTENEVQLYVKEMGEKLYFDGYHVWGEKLIPITVDETFPEYIKKQLCPKEWFRPR